MTLPLGDILLFIEHKKKQCQMPLLASGCCDKMVNPGGGGGGPTLQNLQQSAQQVKLSKVVEPVEIGIQVTPEEEKVGGGERGERMSTRGIYPKQECTLAGRQCDHTKTFLSS